MGFMPFQIIAPLKRWALEMAYVFSITRFLDDTPTCSNFFDERAEEAAIIENSPELRERGHRIVVLSACGLPCFEDFLVAELRTQAGEELPGLLLALLAEVDAVPFDEKIADDFVNAHYVNPFLLLRYLKDTTKHQDQTVRRIQYVTFRPTPIPNPRRHGVFLE